MHIANTDTELKPNQELFETNTGGLLLATHYKCGNVQIAHMSKCRGYHGGTYSTSEANFEKKLEELEAVKLA